NPQRIRLVAARLRDAKESLAECTIHQREHTPFHPVAHRRLHEAGRARRRDVHRARRAEHVAQTGLEGRDELLHGLAAVPDHGLQLGGQHLVSHLGGPGEKEAPEAGSLQDQGFLIVEYGVGGHDGRSVDWAASRAAPCSYSARAALARGTSWSSARGRTEASDVDLITASAPATTAGRATTPANATMRSTPGRVSRSVAPSPTIITGRGSDGPQRFTISSLPPERASGDVVSKPA